ncbi:MAG TPA: hypothetical protein VG943_01625 [Caulobacterales bacterium]|nr:hypothetical protein [Caulobacterales bacterium]
MRNASKVIFAVITAAAFVATAAPSEARGRHVHGSLQTQRGVYQGGANVERGRGFRHRDATITGPNGRQTSVIDDRAWNAREGTYSRDHERTFANGQTRGVETDAQRTAPGAWSAERTVTGRNGETRTQTGDFSVARTDSGSTATGDIQTANHGQVDYARQVSREDGQRTVASSATFEDGASVSRQSTGSCDGAGACNRQTTLTNRAGGETNIDESRTRVGNDVTYSRDATFADGSTRSVDRARDGNGDGSGTITRTVTGRDGETRTRTGSYEVTH